MKNLLPLLIALAFTTPAMAQQGSFDARDFKDRRTAPEPNNGSSKGLTAFIVKLRKENAEQAKELRALRLQVLALTKQVKALGGKVANEPAPVKSEPLRKLTLNPAYPPKIGTQGQLVGVINESFEVTHVIDSTSLLIGKTLYSPRNGGAHHHAGYFIVTGLATAEYITKQSFRIPSGKYTVINPATFNQRKYLTLDFRTTTSK